MLRRHGQPSLLDAYHCERQAVARQVLASSEAMHEFYYGLVDLAVAGKPLVEPTADPSRHVTSPAMLDLALIDSPLLAHHGAWNDGEGPRCGRRFPGRTKLSGCRHHLLVYGEAGGLGNDTGSSSTGSGTGGSTQ